MKRRRGGVGGRRRRAAERRLADVVANRAQRGGRVRRAEVRGRRAAKVKVGMSVMSTLRTAGSAMSPSEPRRPSSSDADETDEVRESESEAEAAGSADEEDEGAVSSGDDRATAWSDRDSSRSLVWRFSLPDALPVARALEKEGKKNQLHFKKSPTGRARE